MENGTVTVIGSFNIGLFARGARLPSPGETVIGDRFWQGAGGKGSNQAIAASRLGASTHLVARIGSDAYGRFALDTYRRYHIATSLIGVEPDMHSGISIILVDENGRNLISVVPGANFLLSEEDIDRAAAAIQASGIVGFQLENRLEVVAYGIRKAHSLGVPVLLDPAPAVPLPEDLYSLIDVIKPNETEAGILTGIAVDGLDSAARAGRRLIELGVRTAILTLGEHGALLVTGEGARHFPAPRVDAVDTTGAGDVFSGALMAGLARGAPLERTIAFANNAASLSVTRLGVVESMPDLAEVTGASLAT